MKFSISVLILFLFFSCGEKTTKSESPTTDTSQYVYVGTYTKKEGHVDGKGKGIHRFSFDKKENQIQINSASSYFSKAINPSFLTISKNKKYLYAVQELGPSDGDSGTIGAYRIDKKTKDLHFLNLQKTDGFAPCHVVVDATNQLAIVSNYMGGVSIFPIKKNGALDKFSQTIKLKGKGTTDRQESSHPHSTTISPDNKFAFIIDLGTDKIMCYRIDLKNKKLIPTEQIFIAVQNGAGPRHFTFHPNKKWAYVINELDASVNTFEYNSTTGKLTQIQSTSTLPDGISTPNWCADIHVHPSGNFLYASNRGHNSIAIFEINEQSGILKLKGTESTKGDFPRNFAIDPSGDFIWVANQNSGDIFYFNINKKTGALTAKGSLKIPTPVCLDFL